MNEFKKINICEWGSPTKKSPEYIQKTYLWNSFETFWRKRYTLFKANNFSCNNYLKPSNK